MSLLNLKKALKEEKLKIGTEITFKLLKGGKVKEVFVSENCPKEIVKRIERYCEISECKLTKLKEKNKDLGAICKRPFSIRVCSYVKWKSLI